MKTYWADQRAERRTTMQKMIESGMLLLEIARELQITHQRVSQLLTTFDLKDLYVIVRDREKSKRRLASDATKDARCLSKRGCDVTTYRELKANGATRAFAQQKRNADSRDIEWELSLGQWWTIWNDSGKWEVRGRGKGGFVMGRKGDLGAYEIGNVEIVSHSQNALTRESHVDPLVDRGGVYRVHPGRKKAWTAYKNKKCLGYFETEEKAKIARELHTNDF